VSHRVAIVGSRDFGQIEGGEKLVRHYIHQLPLETIVISGGAKGPDSWAINTAQERGMRTLVFLADWNKHGKAAGPIRNQQIVDSCDWLVAFYDGKSRGTADSVRRCEIGHIPHAVITWNHRHGRFNIETDMDASNTYLLRIGDC